MPPPSPPERLAFLDALRGWAAFYVFAYHVVRVPEPNLPVADALRPFIYNGGSGVTLFFVVSGFTMCHTLAHRPRTAGTALRFYIRRFARIAPLYYAWLIVMLARSWSWSDFAARKVALASFVTFSFNFKPVWQLGEVWASWTLGVEMVFYLIFPLLFAVVRGRGSAAALTMVAMAAAWWFRTWIHSQPAADYDRDQFLQFSFLTHLPSFSIGMFAYFCYVGAGTGPRRGAPLLSAAVAAIVVIPSVSGGWPYHLLQFAMAGAYATLLLALAAFPVKCLVNPVTIFLGTISYSVYLNHVMTIYLLRPVFASIVATGWPTAVIAPVCGVIAIGPLVVVSVLTYRCIERPGIALGRRAERWMTGSAERK